MGKGLMQTLNPDDIMFLVHSDWYGKCIIASPPLDRIILYLGPIF